ncbi:MAG: prepilin-type N-terminal cleavage/methylation domain-containing protein [Armatimonadota bacterium]
MQIRLRYGFTLIELLVVIAIIAILAAILFPIFNQARERGKIGSCMQNEGQMGKAFLMYCNDYGRWPTQRDSNGDWEYTWIFDPWSDYTGGNRYSPVRPNWCKAVYKYSKNLNIFLCPSVKPSKSSAAYKGYNTYLMNSNVLEKLDSGCSHPSKTMVIMEWGYCESAANALNSVQGITSNHYGMYNQGGVNARGKLQNILYVDGHVKTILADADKFPWWYLKGSQFWDFSDTIPD